jgi:CRISPR-associated protein Cas6/Cse3/CasE subtype I-E
MYVSKIFNIVGDDYAIHKIVMSLFEGQRPLFQNGGGCVTVLSFKPPAEVRHTIETKEVTIPEKQGSVHLFSARFNPVKRSKQTGKRIGLSGKQIHEWIARKSEDNGFAILDMKLSDEGFRICQKSGSKISLRSVMIVGILSIVDSEKFKKAVEGGIGAAKGLGFGLINLF